MQDDRVAYVPPYLLNPLIANGENVKVVQELMRHASTRFTIEIYTQARIEAKRHAQQRLVQAIVPEETNDLAPEVQGSSDFTSP